MELSVILEILKQRALEFHRLLAANNVYHTNISELEYLQRIDEHLIDRAHNVVTGREDLELTKLAIPTGVTYSLLDIIPAASWDYESGYDAFFEDLQKLFSHTSQKFNWSYEQEESKLVYSLNGHTWFIEDLKLNADVDPLDYNEIYQNLDDSLKEQGLLLYDATTGDQSGMLILMPAEAMIALADYLIEVRDPRSEWFYIGMPKENN